MLLAALAVQAATMIVFVTADGVPQLLVARIIQGLSTGAAVGAIGAAIIGGHIDSYRGPGVFYRLNTLRRGDKIYVKRSDGTMVLFKVTSVLTYPKDKFPTQTVYGPTPDAELRLITCGGTFDSTTGHYLSNIVVYATEAS